MSKETKDKLLDSTLSLIDKKPFQQISTKEIAEKSGFSEVTLFRHFVTKESLLDTLIDKFFKMIIGFEALNINTEEEFRTELITTFSKSLTSDPIKRRLFKVFLYMGMYKKKTFFKYVDIYENQLVGPIERIVDYGKEHWGYRKEIDTDIAVKLLINSIGFFNMIQNVFLLREVKLYDFDQIIEIGVDNFIRSLK